MKKLFLMLAVASLSLNAMAQDDPTEIFRCSSTTLFTMLLRPSMPDGEAPYSVLPFTPSPP